MVRRLLLAVGTSTLALQAPLAPELARGGAPRLLDADAAAAGRNTRRDLLSSIAALGSLAVLPPPAHASYALYQSSYDSFQERKSTGYVPVATSDVASLAEIQADIRRKRPQSTLKPEKPAQYCAGQTANVSPMYENICGNIGVSKADQSNSMTDSCARRHVASFLAGTGGRHFFSLPHRPHRLVRTRSSLRMSPVARVVLLTNARRPPTVGNMNIGQYGSLEGQDARAAEARMVMVQQAAEAARLRQMVADQNRR